MLTRSGNLIFFTNKNCGGRYFRVRKCGNAYIVEMLCGNRWRHAEYYNQINYAIEYYNLVTN